MGGAESCAPHAMESEPKAKAPNTEPASVPIAELLDLDQIGPGHRPPTPREIRAALPLGWVYDEVRREAHRDLRLFFSRSWIMILGMVTFGAAGIGFFIYALPRGAYGWLRFLLMLLAVLLAGGIVGPLITRALTKPGNRPVANSTDSQKSGLRDSSHEQSGEQRVD